MNSGRQRNPKGLGENRVMENNRLGLDYNRLHKNTRWVSVDLPNNLGNAEDLNKYQE